MNVLFEFLDAEPIHNVITNLNYRLDKVVYFGYFDDVEKYRSRVSAFLKKYCDDPIVEFIPVKRNNLGKILSVMREAVKKEKEKGNKIFFDVTGGSDMPLVAFGTLSSETETPLHIYNIETGNLREQNEGACYEISEIVPERHVEFDIETFVELMGGTINENERKSNKLLDDEDSIAIAEKLIGLFEENKEKWTVLSKLLNKALKSDGNNHFYYDESAISVEKAGSLKKLLACLIDKGLMEKSEGRNGKTVIRVKNEFVYMNLIEEGAVLELRTCLKLKERYKHVQAGINIDWNGDIAETNNVENEVDVIALDGYKPIIISCKAGRIVGKEALYELEAVANRLGGKYARKMLVTVHPLNPTTQKRAEEMGIILDEIL